MFTLLLHRAFSRTRHTEAMGLTRAELDSMRAVIRSAHGMADPPERAEAHAPAADMAATEPPPQPVPATTKAAAAPAAASPAVEDVAVEAGWRPDGASHRLVELMIALRALADEASASALAPQAQTRALAA